MAVRDAERLELAQPVPLVYDEESRSIDIAALLRILWEGRRVICVLSLAVFAAATLVAFLLPFQFTAVASFIPPTTGASNSMATMLAGQLSMLGASDLLGVKSPGDLYSGILRSRSIAEQLVDENNLKSVYKVKKESQAEKLLDSATQITVDPKTSIVSIAVTDRSPERAQKLDNDYLSALEQANGRLALSQASQRAMFFDKQLAGEKDALAGAEVELKKTEEQSGLIAPTGQTEAVIRTIAETQAQVAVRQVQLAALRQAATEQNPEVIRLRSEIDDLEGQLTHMQNGAARQSQLSIPTSKVPEAELEYVRKEREVKYHEALFEMLSRQYEAARLDEAREAPVLQVLDTASYPDTKSSPKRSYYMLGGLVFGFFAGCTWVFIREPLRALRTSFSEADSDSGA